jgi:ATP-dependent helicase HepA
MLRRSVEPVAREWEKWLKGDQPILSVTFEQDSATENPKTIHLSVVHPLVRQAAQYWEITEPKYFRTSIRSSTIAAGTHLFAIYRWMKHGVKNDELMVPVANDPLLEDQLLSLLQSSMDHDLVQPPDDSEYDALDARHHRKWADAQANHIAENRQIVENRLNSLTVSHRTRSKAIEDQIARATNDKIRLMKQSELVRANADFDQRMSELQRAASTGDIRANPVVFGTIVVTAEEL